MTTQTQFCSENKPALDKQSRLILLGSLFAAGLATPVQAQENSSVPAPAPYTNESVAAGRVQAQFPDHPMGAPAPSTLLTNQVTSMSASTSGTVTVCAPNQAAGTVCQPRNLGCQEGVMCGNPINAATGNKIQQETDFVGGANTGLELRRTYNSLSLDANIKFYVYQTYTRSGTKWSSTWDRGLVKMIYRKEPTGQWDMISVPMADGRSAIFFQFITLKNQIREIWSYPEETSRLSLVKNASGQVIGYQLVTDDDTTELYGIPGRSVVGRLLSITTRAGLKTTLTYDTNDNINYRLTKVTGPFGHTLSFTQNAANRISRVTTPDGRVYAYAYDAKHNLTSVTYPGGAVRKYLYENSKFPDALTGIVDENGVRFATYGYDEEGRATLSEHAGGVEKTTVDYGSYYSEVTDARDNSYTHYLITEFGMVKPNSSYGAVPSSAGSQSFTYDNKGFLASQTDFNGNKTTYTRDARGLELSRTEAVGTPQARTITTAWHPTFHLPTRVTEPGRVTTFTYDVRGNLLQQKVTAGTQTRVWTTPTTRAAKC